jgi:hypothetical protein
VILEGDVESPFWAEQHRIMQGVRDEYLRKIDSGWGPGPDCRGFHDFIPEVELKHNQNLSRRNLQLPTPSSSEQRHSLT